MSSGPSVDVVLEVVRRRAFAVAVDWPGWTRGGSIAEESLHALLRAGPRYAAVCATAGIDLVARGPCGAVVVERLPGAGPSSRAVGAPPGDDAPLDEAGLERQGAILQAARLRSRRPPRATPTPSSRKGPAAAATWRRSSRTWRTRTRLPRAAWARGRRRPGRTRRSRRSTPPRWPRPGAGAGAARAEPQQRHASVAAAVVLPLRHLALAGPRLGDRGPRPTSLSGGRHGIIGDQRRPSRGEAPGRPWGRRGILGRSIAHPGVTTRESQQVGVAMPPARHTGAASGSTPTRTDRCATLRRRLADLDRRPVATARRDRLATSRQ
jgi:hypothetical protein